MRHDAPYLVKRYAPMIGRPESPRRVTTAYQAYSLAEAYRFAGVDAAHRQPWSRPSVFWIERRGQPATRRRSRS